MSRAVWPKKEVQTRTPEQLSEELGRELARDNNADPDIGKGLVDLEHPQIDI